MDFCVGFKSEWEVTLTDAKSGKVKLYLPWHKNTILDTGLNYLLATSSQFTYLSSTNTIPSMFGYIAIGTNNTAPATTDTGLITEISRKIYNANLCSYSAAVAAAPYFIVGAQWGTSEGNGDLKEVGLCTASTGGTFWSRNLFRDEAGDPITVTKTSADILTVSCKVTITRASETPYSVTLDGRTVKGIILNSGLAIAARAPSLGSYSWWRSDTWSAGTSNVDPAVAQTGLQGSSLGSSASVVWSAAVTGPPNFYREGVISFLSYQGIGSIGEVFAGSSVCLTSRHTFDAAMVKDNTKQLDLTIRITLSRV